MIKIKQPPLYVKKSISKTKMFMGSHLFLFAFLIIFVFIFYSGDLTQILEALIFCYLSIVILVCFLIPFVNFLLVFFAIDFYDMILGIMRIHGDLFTEVFFIAIIVTYMIIIYTVILSTLIIALEYSLNPERFDSFWQKLEIISLYKPSKKI